MTADLHTIVVASALALTVLAIFVTATWRLTIKPRWQRFTWTPKLTPEILAEWILIMGKDGRVAMQFEKLAPEVNHGEVFASMLQQVIDVGGGSLGITLNYSSKIWRIVETAEGPVCIVPLMQPKEQAVRAMTEAERLAMGESA